MKQLWKAALVAIVESKYMIRICAGHVLKALSCFSLMQFRVAAMSDGGIKHKAKVPSFCPRACVRAAMKIEFNVVRSRSPPAADKSFAGFWSYIYYSRAAAPPIPREDVRIEAASTNTAECAAVARDDFRTFVSWISVEFPERALRGTHTLRDIGTNLHLQPYTLL